MAFEKNKKYPYGKEWEDICKMAEWGTSQEQDDALMRYVRRLQDKNKELEDLLEENVIHSLNYRIDQLTQENHRLHKMMNEILDVSFVQEALKQSYSKGKSEGYDHCSAMHEEYRFNGECGIG